MAAYSPVTDRAVKEISDEIGGERRIHLVTFAFLRSILQPLEQSISTIDDREELVRRVLQSFPSLEEVIEARLEMEEEDEDPITGANMRQIIIGEIVDNLLTMIVDSVLLPWDIVDDMSPDDAAALGIDIISKTLPVTVTVGSQQFTHLMTVEQALGLILFSRTAGVDFHPSMYGTELTYFQDFLERSRFEVTNFPVSIDPIYRVDIGPTIYQFRSPAFMQGFATGALWANTDHHAYWNNLLLIAAPAPPTTLHF